MANVVPKETLQQLRTRISARFLLVFSLMLLAGAIVALMSIVPAYIAVRSAHAALDSAIEEAVNGVNTDKDIAAKTQRLVTQLNPVLSSTTTPASALVIALQEKPAGMAITSASYSSSPKPNLILTGTVRRREDVSAFRTALEATKRFSSIDIPVNALVGAQEGKFTVTLYGI